MIRIFVVATVLLLCILNIQGKIRKQCPRSKTFPKCMFEHGTGVLWCDRSNYVNFHQIQIEEGLEQQVLALNLNDSCVRKLHSCKHLRSFSRLKKLNLGDNLIEDVPEKAFKANSKLENIELNTNFIRVISRGAFHGLTGLKSLSIDDNSVSSLSSDWLRDLRGVNRLSMRKNDIKEIRRNHLSTLKELFLLDLTENKIRYIDDNAFHGMRNLRDLHLDGNQLAEVNSRIFHGLQSLRVISLSENMLSKWEMFRMPQLQHIDLSSNQLINVSGNAFSSYCNLKNVNLRNNKLTHLDSGWLLRPAASGNFTLDLRDNHWHCRCAAVHFQEQLNVLGSVARNGVAMGVTCAEPRYARNKTLLDKDLMKEIEFRADCTLSSSQTLAPPEVTKCQFASSQTSQTEFAYLNHESIPQEPQTNWDGSLQLDDRSSKQVTTGNKGNVVHNISDIQVFAFVIATIKIIAI